MWLPRQEYWSGLPCPSLGDFPHPGIKAMCLAPSALASRFLTTEPSGKLEGAEVPAISGWHKHNGMFYSKVDVIQDHRFTANSLWMFYQCHKVLIQVTFQSPHSLFGSSPSPKWTSIEQLTEYMLHGDLDCLHGQGKNLKCIEISSLAKKIQIGRLPRVVVSPGSSLRISQGY